MKKSPMNLHKPFLLALALAASTLASAQHITKQERVPGSAFPNWITFSGGVTPASVPGVLEKELDWPGAFGLAPRGNLFMDRLGYGHQRYRESYHGIPVFGATVVLHSLNGQVRSMNGDLVEARPDAGTGAAMLDKDAALAAAKQHVGARSYMWESPEMEAFIKREQQDPTATFLPKAELIYYPLSFPQLTGELRLAYQLDVYAMAPRSRQDVIVDAHTGEVLASYQRIHDVDEPGTAETAYSGNRPIITYRPGASGPYQLKDLSRGGGVRTYDCFDTDNYGGAQIPENASNDWDYGSIYGNAILDAHWGTERTYDYYLNEQNWDSYDNNGSPMLSYVHFNLIDYGYPNNNNAFWDGQRMTYGDGDGNTLNPLTAIDVSGHEITHGVTENSAGLEYADESGALNESYSDIMGTSIEFYAKPEGFSWLLGNDMSVDGSAFRNMADPNENGDPDTYQGTYWATGPADNGGVHTNSGVQNYWFYLLSEGGTGENDNGDDYAVQGIGIPEAGDIAFRALTVYMNANSDYADARSSAIQAATDLFGDCSDQLIATTNAWYAVGVGAPFNDAVVAGFTASANYSCTAPATVQFANNSLNASTYLWDFGDGNSSTEEGPEHVYADPGSYTVTLIAYGNTLCNGSDTLVQAMPIVVESSGPLLPAACAPEAANPTTDAGIFAFTIADIDKESSGALDGYQDFSCEQVSTLTEGLSYPVNIALHTLGYAALWIDMDNDGAFSSSEEVYHASLPSLNHAANIIVPAGTVFGTRLRLRILSDTQPITSPCSISNGQAEDYSVRILDNDAAPIADFTANPVTVLVGSTTSFQDLSLNAPTTWQWTFEGGDAGTSTEQHPVVGYSTTGYYDVQLIVSNAQGTDTLLLPDYIHVVNSFNLCQVETTGADNGTFYDPGGPDDNYFDNETCTLLIAPPCAATITVNFISFNTESNYDFLRFYDGNSTSAPSLGVFDGSNLPAGFTTTGGQLFVQWTADQSVNRSGFEVEWTSQAGSTETISASAAADALNPAFGQSVQFTDNSAETPTSWFWDFGDGSSSTEQNPAHAYQSSGPKTVILTASNCVSTGTDTLYLQVQAPPVAVIAPEALTMAAEACQDSVEGSFTIHNTGNGPLQWTLGSEVSDDFEGSNFNPDMWSFSNGHPSDDCGPYQGSMSEHFNASGSRRIETRPFPMNGDSHFAFHMIYGSGGNCEDVDEGEFVVLEYSLDGTDWTLINSYSTIADYFSWTLIDEHLPPAAQSPQTRLRLRQVDNSGAPYDVWAIDAATLYTADTGPLITATLAGTVAPGDSSVVPLGISTADLSPGSHELQLQVFTNDPDNPVMDYTVTVVVPDAPCAGFDFTVDNACNGSVQFNNTTMHDAGTWHWDFGDGSTSDLENPLHTYAAEGDYTVVLTAGSGANSSTHQVQVQVSLLAASFTHTDPDANNGAVTFTPNTPGATQWLWDFGDGSSSTDEAPAHTYAAQGTYMVILAASNDAGCTAMDTVLVYFGTSGIAELAAYGIAALPNPNQGHFTLRLRGVDGPVSGTILDGYGRVVSGNLNFRNGNNAVDISKLADGLYILRLRMGNMLRHVRITKQ